MTSLGMAPSLLSLLPLVGFASAVDWTITTTLVAVQTTETYTYAFDSETFTDTYTEWYPLVSGATAPTSAAISTTTYTDYDDVEQVIVYVDGAALDPEDIHTAYYDDLSDENYDNDDTYTYSSWLQPVAMTAPRSCSSQFTYNAFVEVYVPTAIVSAGSVTPVSASTSIESGRYSTYYYVANYLSSDAFSLTEDVTDMFTYSYYVAYCTNPAEYFGETTYSDSSDTAYPSNTWSFGGGSSNDDDDSDYFEGGRFGIDECSNLMHCGWLTTALIIIAAVLPAIFLLGFLESYFWFRRMMIGKSALRFGTICWMFLLLPVICLTKRTPARDADAQAALREKWRAVGFGTALGLWFKLGFRHRYPTEHLGEHPTYSNAWPSSAEAAAAAAKLPGMEQQQQPMGYGPPPPGMPPGGQPPVVYYYPPGQAPPPQAAYYPQYPPQAMYAPAGAPPQQRSSRGRASQIPSVVSSPSPISEEAEPVRGPEGSNVSPPGPPPAEPASRPPPPPEAGPSSGPPRIE